MKVWSLRNLVEFYRNSSNGAVGYSCFPSIASLSTRMLVVTLFVRQNLVATVVGDVPRNSSFTHCTHVVFGSGR